MTGKEEVCLTCSELSHTCTFTAFFLEKSKYPMFSDTVSPTDVFTHFAKLMTSERTNDCYCKYFGFRHRRFLCVYTHKNLLHIHRTSCLKEWRVWTYPLCTDHCRNPRGIKALYKTGVSKNITQRGEIKSCLEKKWHAQKSHRSPLLTPVQLLPHDLDDARQCFVGRLHV